MQQSANKKNEYAKAVCYFLAEQLRVHKVSLNRAADIASKFLQNLNLINTEHDFLKLIKELSKDFEELVRLEQLVYFHLKEKERLKLERVVSECVINNLAVDPGLALSLLEQAIKPGVTIEKLIIQFPILGQANAEHIRSN